MPIKLNYNTLFYISVGVIILLFLWIFKDFMFSVLPSIPIKETLPKEITWFEIIILVFGGIWTFVVFRLERKSSKNSEIQNKLAFEVNRPVLAVENQENSNPVIINKGSFEAVGLKVYNFYFDDEKIKIEENKEFKDKIIYPNLITNISYKQGYSSIIFFYQNPASGLYYISGFNYDRPNKKVYSIGADLETVKSPVSTNQFTGLANEINIKNQIYNNIKPENNFDRFLQDFI
jgi:hypothetical protein